MAGGAVPPRQPFPAGAADAGARPSAPDQVPEEEGQGHAHVHPDNRVLPLPDAAAEGRNEPSDAADGQRGGYELGGGTRAQLRWAGALGRRQPRAHHGVSRQVEEIDEGQQVKGSHPTPKGYR